MTIDPGSLASLPVHVRQQLADLLRAIAGAVERGDEDSVCALAGALNRPPSHPHVPSPHQGAAVAPGPPCPAHRGNCCCF